MKLAWVGLLVAVPAFAFEAASPDDRAFVAKQLARARDNEADRTLAIQRAVRRTLVAHSMARLDSGDELVLPRGPAAFAALAGRNLVWSLVAFDPDTDPLRPRRGLRAYTSVFGVTNLLQGALASPQMLAATLLHESVHFRQYTTEGIRLNDEELEVEAYTTELANLDKLGLSPEDAAVHEKFLRREIEFHRKQSTLLKAERAQPFYLVKRFWKLMKSENRLPELEATAKVLANYAITLDRAARDEEVEERREREQQIYKTAQQINNARVVSQAMQRVRIIPLKKKKTAPPSPSNVDTSSAPPAAPPAPPPLNLPTLPQILDRLK